MTGVCWGTAKSERYASSVLPSLESHPFPATPEDLMSFHPPIGREPSAVALRSLRSGCFSSRAPRSRPVPNGRPGRTLLLLRAFVAVGVLTHCDADSTSLHSVLREVGVEDAPVLEALDIHVLCDASEDGVCSSSTASPLLERVAHVAFLHPGSDLSVFALGDRPADTLRLASITVPPATDRGERAARAAEERFVASVRAAVCPALDAVLAQRHPRHSPIVEALDEIALAKHPSRRVEIFPLSDNREVSDLGDFECDRSLPTPAAFEARLRRRGLLRPGSFARTRVHFVTGDHGPVARRGCAVSMGRERDLQVLWRSALVAAGAAEVTFHVSVPSVDAITTLFSTPRAAADAGTRVGSAR